MISYDGVLEPLGHSQILQYLVKLARDHKIILVSYEKAGDWTNAAERQLLIRQLREAHILWMPLRYHKSPTVPATSFDLFVGFWLCAYLTIRYRVEIVHARSYVPAILAAILRSLFRVKFVFDMRGFWADEKVDGGQWQRGSWLYATAKWFEKMFFTKADVVVSLTYAGVEEVRKFPYLQQRVPRFEVISTCTNLELFHPQNSFARNGDQPFTLGYVGTVSGWYLFEPALRSFLFLKEIEPSAQLLILNRGEHNFIHACLTKQNIAIDQVEVRSVAYHQVPLEMNRMDAAMFFIKPVFSKRASAATKLGELLGCGVPCLSNDGVGDMTQIIEGEGVGVILREFTPDAQRVAIQRLVRLARQPDTRTRCVAAAQRYFSLDDGVKAYHHIYQSLQDT
ncbi:MAG: glycosyltransferase [Nitrospirae bacterium]|nr:glycosyltransferase [Nitrospirota bacterium]